MTRFYLFLLLLGALQLRSQSPIGSWEVVSVQVGDRSMTPQAKWIVFEEAGFFGGNGFLQNSAGTYTWNPLELELHMEDSLGFPDPFSPFKLSWVRDTMVWQREEEGQLVRVFLGAMEEKPLRPADHITGVWLAPESDSLAYIRFGWTQTYEFGYKEGPIQRGVWRCHPHRNEVILLPWKREEATRSYQLEIASWNDLYLKDFDGNQSWRLKRSRDYPD